MKHPFKALLCILVCSLIFISCKKETKPDVTPEPDIPAEVIAVLKNEGLSTHQIKKVAGGYVVEGDIFLSDKWLEEKKDSKKLLIAKTEQYKTLNLIAVNGSREITVSVEGLPATYVGATDNAIARYNALGLNLTFRRVASGGEIRIINEALPVGELARSGFPTADGNPPADPIKMNYYFLGMFPPQGYLASIIAHEMGHCIGFRHTDYFNRLFSCGTGTVDEGQSSEGAVNIPGTPTTEEWGSWMLACFNGEVDRPFTANDIVALRYLYGGVRPIPDGVYRITAMHSGKVLDVYDASLATNTMIIQYPWVGDNNQRWYFTFLGNGYYRIEAVHSWLAMTYNTGGIFGTNPRLVQNSWSGSTLQQWKVSVVQPGQFAIECKFNGQVLDVFDASLDDGVKIITFPWNGDGNQRWTLTGL